jgi:uncharacterized damage-inducible protein DinB
MTTRADMYRKFFQYEQDSHLKVLRALEAAPGKARGVARYQDAVDMMAHLIAARQIWLWRIGQFPSRPEVMFPKGVLLSALKQDIDTIHEAWRNYLAALTDEELDRVVEFKMLDGREASSRVEDILTQLHGHSLYHRGQVSVWMKEAGATPAPTDYLIWVREQGA